MKSCADYRQACTEMTKGSAFQSVNYAKQKFNFHKTARKPLQFVRYGLERVNVMNTHACIHTLSPPHTPSNIYIYIRTERSKVTLLRRKAPCKKKGPKNELAQPTAARPRTYFLFVVGVQFMLSPFVFFSNKSVSQNQFRKTLDRSALWPECTATRFVENPTAPVSPTKS